MNRARPLRDLDPTLLDALTLVGLGALLGAAAGGIGTLIGWALGLMP